MSAEATRKTFKLSEPVEIKSGTFTELHLRKPKGRDLRTLNTVTESSGSIAGYFEVISHLAEVPLEVVDEAPMQDCRAMIRWIDSFFDQAAA